MAQQGFVYEENAAKVLKEYDIVPKNFRPAGAGSDIPDLIIKHNGMESGCELKITAASAGSLVLKYDASDMSSPWKFGDIKATDDEKLFISELADEVGLFDIINKKWNKKPLKRINDPTVKAFTKDMPKRDIYDSDKKNFPEIKGEISAKKIEEYYNKKKTYYINVGTHGFYLLGARNPLNLKGLDRFGNAAKAKYRCRVQSKGGGNYQFTFEMSFSISAAQRSDFNIAPLKKGSVNIVEDELSLGCFI